MQHYVITFVSYLWQLAGHHDITEIVLKVALNTIIFIYVTVTCCLRIIFGLQGHRPLVIAI